MSFINKSNIGLQITKSTDYLQSLKKFYEIKGNDVIPTLIFTSNGRTWETAPLNNTDIIKTYKYIKDKKLSVFIHSNYLIDLCRKPDSEELKKSKESLIYDIKIGQRICAKGVILHTGKFIGMDEQSAVEMMYENLKDILKYVHHMCPLVLETPSGQMPEILTKMEDFVAFYQRFNEEELKRLKICVNTCHVFVTDHIPSEYIKYIHSKVPKSIILVTLNDSVFEKGSKKDKHAVLGYGKLGIKEIQEIVHFSKFNNIPMIREYKIF